MKEFIEIKTIKDELLLLNINQIVKIHPNTRIDNGYITTIYTSDGNYIETKYSISYLLEVIRKSNNPLTKKVND